MPYPFQSIFTDVSLSPTSSLQTTIIPHPHSHTSAAGQKVVALIETSLPICVERFVDYPQLGRFTLRDEGRTIAIGKVRQLRGTMVLFHLIYSPLQITKLIDDHHADEVAEGVAHVSIAA